MTASTETVIGATPAKIVISCTDVQKTYGSGATSVTALRNVSFSVNAGENIAIVGRSGSGKSTLLQIIGCLDRPTSGSFFVNERSIAKLDDDALSRLRGQEIGFVFQAFHLLPRMSLLENVALPLFYQGFNKRDRLERARECLELVQLVHRGHHRPHELSGGEKQRGAIARAIVHKPALLLADEPTGNLDSQVKREILERLCELNSKLGVTLITVTHDDETAAAANRIIYLRDGEIANAHS
jgi:putative ABC transport system ATP-binding protein